MRSQILFVSLLLPWVPPGLPEQWGGGRCWLRLRPTPLLSIFRTCLPLAELSPMLRRVKARFLCKVSLWGCSLRPGQAHGVEF